MCGLVSLRYYSFFICACSLSCFWVALLSASVFVVHVQTVLPRVWWWHCRGCNNQFVVVCQHFYIWLNFPFIFPLDFSLSLCRSLGIVQCFCRLEFTGRFVRLFGVFFFFFFVIVLVVFFFSWCVLSCIFCEMYALMGSKLQLSSELRAHKNEPKPRVVTETIGLLFSFSFNCLCCYILFIGNSFACLLFFICFVWSLSFFSVLCVRSTVSELESRKC